MAIPNLLDTWNRLTDAIYYGNDVASGTLVPTSRTISTTAPITGGGDLSANRTIGITLTGGGTGAVGTGRTINTTAPITGGGTLANDLTLVLTTTPAGQTPVGAGRTITTTTPLKIDGGASANLNADRTLSVIPFTGAVDGIVTHNPSGVEGKFLKDDNTWGTSAASGVSSITGVSPMVVAPTTGDTFVAVSYASILVDGVVPATGGADATKYLSATNPLSWTTPGAGTYVRLQGSTPGTADVGSTHIDGSAIVEDTATVGAATSVGIGTVESLSQSGGLYGYFARTSGTTAFTHVRQQHSRGTLAAPTATANNDELGGIFASGYTASGAWSGNISAGLIVKADGTPSATEQPAYVDVTAGSVGTYHIARLSSSGLLIKKGSLGSSDRSLSTLDVYGSTGLRALPKTSSFSADSVGTTYYVDATGGAITITLPAASGCSGRIYAFERVDIGANAVVFSGTIQGVASYQLSQGETLIIQSDGSNWYRFGFRSQVPYTKLNVATSSVVSGTVTKTSFDQNVTLNIHQRAYNNSAPVFMNVYAQGQYDTHASGTNSITMYLRTSGQDIVGSRSITLTNGLSNENWTMHAMIHLNSPSNMQLVYGRLDMYDAAGDKSSVLLPATPLYAGSALQLISAGVQWSNTNAGNEIDQRHLMIQTSENFAF